MVDSSRVCWLVVAKGYDLTLTDIGCGHPVGFGGGIIMCVLRLPEVVYAVGLLGIDIGSECLRNRLYGVCCSAICLLVKGYQWHKENIESFVEFPKEIGDKLGSSIRDNFLGYSMIAVDLTYECIDVISGCVLLFHRH